MAGQEIFMRRIKLVLRLGYELGLGQWQIARSCSIGQSAVFDYLKLCPITFNALEGYKHLIGYHGCPDQHSLGRSTA